MGMNTVDEANMINKPVRYARSVVDYQVGDVNFFFSGGWLVYAQVLEIICSKMFSKFKIYLICNIEYMEYRGLEYTEKELLKIKELDAKLQRRYDRLEEEFRKELRERNENII